MLALGLIGYTLFRNVYPYPEEAAALYPAVSAAGSSWACWWCCCGRVPPDARVPS